MTSHIWIVGILSHSYLPLSSLKWWNFWAMPRAPPPCHWLSACVFWATWLWVLAVLMPTILNWNRSNTKPKLGMVYFLRYYGSKLIAANVAWQKSFKGVIYVGIFAGVSGSLPSMTSATVWGSWSWPQSLSLCCQMENARSVHTLPAKPKLWYW